MRRLFYDAERASGASVVPAVLAWVDISDVKTDAAEAYLFFEVGNAPGEVRDVTVAGMEQEEGESCCRLPSYAWKACQMLYQSLDRLRVIHLHTERKLHSASDLGKLFFPHFL